MTFIQNLIFLAMKSPILFSLLLASNFVFSQKKYGEIEISPFVRFDNYPQISYNYMGRASTDYLKLKGKSFGVSLAYKIPISKSLFFRPAIGYYRYTFDDIKRENNTFGKTNSRDINYPSPLYILFYTDKYWYNCILANVGIEKKFIQSKFFQINASINLCNYLSFSQYYHLIFNPDNGSQNYKKGTKKYFGTTALTIVNPVVKLNNIQFGPSLMLPVFDIWETDKTFGEESNARTKWLRGIGVGFTCSYLLH